MDTILLFSIALITLVVVIKWRLKTAETKLQGIQVPPSMESRHSDGKLYYFYHPACGPCRSMMPIIEELMEKYPGRIEKYNVADHRDIAMAMGIRATPTTILVNTNKISKAIIGARSSRVLEAMLATSND